MNIELFDLAMRFVHLSDKMFENIATGGALKDYEALRGERKAVLDEIHRLDTPSQTVLLTEPVIPQPDGYNAASNKLDGIMGEKVDNG